MIELEKKPKQDNPAPPSNEKNVALVKGKGKGRKVAAHASSQVSVCFLTKASVPRITALATTVVGSPTTTPLSLHRIHLRLPQKKPSIFLLSM